MLHICTLIFCYYTESLTLRKEGGQWPAPQVNNKVSPPHIVFTLVLTVKGTVLHTLSVSQCRKLIGI